MPRCPQCGKGPARPGLRRGAFEFLLQLIAIHPFRCQFCTYRFLAVRVRPTGQSRREYDRIRVNYATLLSPALSHDEAEGVTGTIRDLSMRGCLVESDVPLAEGTCLRLDFQVLNGEPPIAIDGAVVRSIRGRKKRLAFFKMSPDSESRIRRLIEIHLHNRQP